MASGSRFGHWKLLGGAASLLCALTLFWANMATATENRNQALPGLYTGIYLGVGLGENSIVDPQGFANWGEAGWTVDYDDKDPVGGLLFGRSFEFLTLPFRVELDAGLSAVSAKTNLLDPAHLDETAISSFKWITTARAGIEKNIGPMTLFATGGLAMARIRNSVTDIDFGPGQPSRVDPDDSFAETEVETGWVVGGGIEGPVAKSLYLRFEGLYMDFGKSSWPVNIAADGRCGPDGERTVCYYDVQNRLATFRAALIYRF